MTAIEWTHIPGFKGETWNPIVGCSIVSPGCTHCYAMNQAARIQKMTPQTHYAGTTQHVNGNHVWTGKIVLAPDHILEKPLRAKQPRAYFVNSMGDLFHEAAADEWIDRVFAVMALCPQHIFMVLTKRAERMRSYIGWDAFARIYAAMMTFTDAGFPTVRQTCEALGLEWIKPRSALDWWPLHNVWLGVTAEDQTRADERVPHLLATPAAKRFVSYEPALGPVDFRNWINDPEPAATAGEASATARPQALGGKADKTRRRTSLRWIIAGGESGVAARPAHPDWFRAVRDQCAMAGVPFFFKQWGEHLPVGQILPGGGKVHGATAVEPGRMKLHYGGTPKQAPKHAFAGRGVEVASTDDGRLTFRVGKRRAGALLDGREHREWPPL